jgi:hypothetical protein
MSLRAKTHVPLRRRAHHHLPTCAERCSWPCRARTYRDVNTRFGRRRRVVDTVTGHGDDAALLLQAFDKLQFVSRLDFAMNLVKPLFLAVVIDLVSRQVVGWWPRQDMMRDLVIDAFARRGSSAIRARRPVCCSTATATATGTASTPATASGVCLASMTLPRFSIQLNFPTSCCT